eukprot:GHVU01064468.1.p1 GENE.GHVU01064468.1~~GHVU01064468.1.p1  ORF type:complete len:245 (-),score=50.16 GHVU01064468.1:146-880(-)
MGPPKRTQPDRAAKGKAKAAGNKGAGRPGSANSGRTTEPGGDSAERPTPSELAADAAAETAFKWLEEEVERRREIVRTAAEQEEAEYNSLMEERRRRRQQEQRAELELDEQLAAARTARAANIAEELQKEAEDQHRLRRAAEERRVHADEEERRAAQFEKDREEEIRERLNKLEADRRDLRRQEDEAARLAAHRAADLAALRRLADPTGPIGSAVPPHGGGLSLNPGYRKSIGTLIPDVTIIWG